MWAEGLNRFGPVIPNIWMGGRLGRGAVVNAHRSPLEISLSVPNTIYSIIKCGLKVLTGLDQ